MKFRTTLILLALVIGLGAFLVIYTSRQPNTQVYKEDQARLFATREFADPNSPSPSGLADVVAGLELRDGASRIALERSGEGPQREWRIVKPVSALADSGAVTAILSDLEFLKVAARLKAEKGQPLDLKSYGLDAPERSITFGFGARSWTLNVGTKTADGKSVYVERQDAQPPVVCVVPASVLEKAEQRVNDLRDKAALRFDKTALTGLNLVPAAGPALELRKDPTGWRIVKGVQDEAAAESVASLLDALAGLRVEASDFLADDDRRAPEFGLDKPRFKIDVVEGTGARSLWLGSDVKDHPEKCYARREGDPTLFALEKKAGDGLMKTAADLRSKSLLAFNPDDVAALTIALAAEADNPARTIRFTQTNDVWKMDEPTGLTADSEQVKLFLNDLHNVEVSDWVDAPTAERVAECGLAAPQLKITLTLQSVEAAKPAAKPAVVLFGKPAEKPETCYARRGEQGPVLVVPSELVNRLAVGYLAFVSRKVLEFNKYDAVALKLVRPSGAISLEKQKDNWTVLEPPQSEVNGFKVDDLFFALCHLEATRVAAEKAASLGTYGLDAPRVKISVTLKPSEGGAPGLLPPSTKPAEVKTVLLGKELPDGTSYAMLEGGERVFVLGRATADLFLADLVKPKKPEPPPKPAEAPPAGAPATTADEPAK